MTIRVGKGQTPSGKILDRGTQAYVYIKRKGIDERFIKRKNTSQL